MATYKPGTTEAVAVVVNDDATQCNLLCGLLRKGGLQARAFEGAEAALSGMDRDNPPDLIVTDLYMPGIDGWRFCRLLRSPEYEAFNAVPILVVSATFAGEEARRITADLGANAFMSSPVESRRFIEQARSLIDGDEPRERLRVLIVEDSKTLAGILKKAFEAQGAVANAAFTVSEGMAALAEANYDVAVMDYHLPDGKGDALLSGVGGHSLDCVAIMMTTDPDPQLAVQWMKQGAAAYLRKPFEPAYLLELVARTRRERSLLRVKDLLETRTRQLQEESTLLSETQRIAHVGSWRYDVALDRLTWSDEVYRIFGIEPGEFGVSYEAFFEAIHPEDRSSVEAAYSGSLKDGSSGYEIDHRLIHKKSGEVRYVHERCVHIHNASGQAIASIGIVQDITDRKRMEHVLERKSSERRLLLDTIPVQVWYLTDTETYGGVNRAHVDFLGKQFRDVAYKRLDEFVSPDVADVCKKSNIEVFETKRLIHTEEWIANAEGEKRLIAITKTPRLDQAGQVEWVVCTGVDITEQRKAEKLLRQSRENLHNTLNSLNDGVIQIDRDFVVSVGNRAMAKLFGIPKEQMAGRHCYEMIHGRNEICSGCQVKAFFDGEIRPSEGQPLFHEIRSMPDGRVLDRKVYPTLREEGRSAGVTVVVSDVTAEKQAEESLRKERDFSEGLIETAQAIILVLDTEGRIVRFNPYLEELTGWRLDEVKGKDWFETFLTADDSRIVKSRFQKAVHDTQTRGSSNSIVARDGHAILVEWFDKTLKKKDGEVVGLLAVGQDITERVALQERLLQMEKAASLSRMAGAVAHHFNNLMTVVMGNLDLARMDVPQESELDKTLLEAFRGSQRAADLSRLMLTMLGMTPSKRKPVDLSKACRDDQTGLRSAIPERVTLKTEFCSPGPVVDIDPAQMKEVLVSLVTNAWEAMGDSAGTIGVSVSTASAEDIPDTQRFPVDWEPSKEVYACLTVTDSGCGMDDQTISRIFDPFYTDKFTGRGLGLAVTLGMVKSFGGCITVKSDPGKGSIFRVFIPTSSEPVSPPPLANLTGPEKASKRTTILLADDDEMVRDSARFMLMHFGFEVLTAEDGPTAVDIFRKRKDEIGLVISDLTMPGMDGWETLAALREIRPDIPVILVSGYDDALTMTGDYAERPQAFLSKPYKMSGLKTALAKALGGAEST